MKLEEKMESIIELKKEKTELKKFIESYKLSVKSLEEKLR